MVVLIKKKTSAPTPNVNSKGLNREAWLTELGFGIVPLIEEVTGEAMPKFRISVSFPSRRGLATKRRTVGQCWSGVASKDGTVEVLVSPVKDDPRDIAGTIAHELVHGNIGTELGHGTEFKHVGSAIGLLGKPTHMGDGESGRSEYFHAHVDPIIKQLGPYPHAALIPSAIGAKAQTTYLRKVYCKHCGYTMRVTQTWLDKAVPMCPLGHGAMIVQHGKAKAKKKVA